MRDETREFLIEADGRIYQVTNSLFDEAYWSGQEDCATDDWEHLNSREIILKEANSQIREQIAEVFKAGFLKGLKYADSAGIFAGIGR